MRLLLDTHTFLWFVTNDPLLSATAQALIADPTNEIVVSPASYWEVAIKVSIGKYPMTVVGTRSFHTGLVQVLLLDGASRGINNNINLTVWRSLATRDGKESLTDF